MSDSSSEISASDSCKLCRSASFGSTHTSLLWFLPYLVSLESDSCSTPSYFGCYTGKNNRFPFLDILGYLKNAHKNPKFGRVRQVPIGELGWEFLGWDLSHFAKFGIFMGIF